MSIKTRRSAGNASRIARFMVGTALSGLTAAGAQAQTASTPETVVVTGTSIRGTESPTGANLITVDRATIESQGVQTVQQLLTSVPQISSAFASSGQGAQNGDGTGQFIPAIHSLGGGASEATLILIDGHRIPGAGLTVIDTDPSVVPASVVERVEVLPDGASSIYGSDAVAGVINFITRKNFTGLETSAQYGFADHYSTFDANALWGKSWGGGSVLVSYDYTSQSQLSNGDRGFLSARHDIYQGAANPANFTGLAASPPAGSMTVTQPAGPGTTAPFGVAIPYPSLGSNSQTFNCPVATIAASSTATNAYYYQPGGGYGGAAYSTSTGSAPGQGACDSTYASSALPSETRNNGMIQLRQAITDNLSFDLEAIYASRLGTSRSSRGTVSAAVFGPTSPATTQINPFYVGNAATGTNSEFVRYDFNSLLGPGAFNKTAQQQNIIESGLTWDLGGDRELVLSGTAGQDYNESINVGTVSQAEAFLALNGTTNANGSLTTPSAQSVFGTGASTITTQTLNTNNALDVWDPASSNKTSAAVIRSLKDGGQQQYANQGLQDVVAKFDGPIFDLPAGALKVAVGAEFLHQTTLEYGAGSLAAGPASQSSQGYRIPLGRQVYSTFVEFNIPLVSPEMNIPLVESLSVDMSGRYDKYSDNGDTVNPKVAFDWLITDGLKARATYGTSFVANDIHHSGQLGTGFNSESGVSAAGNPTPQVIPFPGFGSTTYNGGAGIAGTYVATAPTCAAGGGQPVDASGNILAPANYGSAVGCKVAFGAVQGATTSAALRISGGTSGLTPAIGTNYSAGFDFNFGKYTPWLDGLTASITYYDVKYHNLKTSVGTQAGIQALTTFAPPGGWSVNSTTVQNAIAGLPINIALPSTVYAIYLGTIQNAYNIWQNGLDFDAHYRYKTDDLGNFTFGFSGNEILRASQQVVGNNPVVDVKGGKNSGRFTYIEFEGRFDLGWAIGNWNTTVGINYVKPYTTTSSAFPFNLAGPGRAAGTFHVGGYAGTDMGVTYTLPQGLWGMPDMATSGTRVTVNVNNITNEDPVLTPTGTATGSIIGREFEIGIHKKF